MKESIWISRAGSVWGKCEETGLYRFSAQSCKNSLKELFVSCCPLAPPQSLTCYILLPCACRQQALMGNTARIQLSWGSENLKYWEMCELLMQKRPPEGVLILPLPTCRLSSSSWPECRCHQKGCSRGFPTCSINPCMGSQAAPFYISSYFWQLLTKSHPRVWEVQTFPFINLVGNLLTNG